MDELSASDLKSVLHSKRANIYYLEHCRVLVNGGRVEYVTDQGKRSLYWNMRDHVNVDDMKPVPATDLHRTIQRIQVQSSAARLRRRLMRRKDISEAEALKQIPDSASRQTDLPFITLRSQSTGQTFPLFIRHNKASNTSTPGTFNAYGLSQTATVPWF